MPLATALTNHLLGASLRQLNLKPLPQPTIFWAFSVLQIALKNECKDSLRSQLTYKCTAGKLMLCVYSPFVCGDFQEGQI